MGVIVKGTGYTNQISKVIGHLKYIGFRSDEIAEKKVREELGLDKGRFFTKDKNSEDYKVFLKDIETDKRLKHSKSIKAHKLVFSLKEVDFDNYLKLSNKSYKNLVRETLEEFGKTKNQNLKWIAVEHLTDNDNNKSKHPHVHVVIKGVAEDGTRVKFKKEDYQLMRDIFDKEFNKVVEYEKSYYREIDLNRNLEKELSNTLKKVFNSIEKDFEKSFREKQKIRNEQNSRERKRNRI